MQEQTMAEVDSDCEDADEVVDGENVNVLFNMCSEYEPKGHMAVDDVSETAKALNDIMYDAFIYYISEQVCAIMKKAN